MRRELLLKKLIGTFNTLSSKLGSCLDRKARISCHFRQKVRGLTEVFINQRSSRNRSIRPNGLCHVERRRAPARFLQRGKPKSKHPVFLFC